MEPLPPTNTVLDNQIHKPGLWITIIVVILVVVGSLAYISYTYTHSVSPKDMAHTSSAIPEATPLPARTPSSIPTDFASAHAAIIATCPVTCTVDGDVKSDTNFVESKVNLKSGGSYTALVKKTDNTWTVAWTGQTTIPQSIATKYIVPASFGPFN